MNSQHMPTEPNASVTRRILQWAQDKSRHPYVLPALGGLSGLDYVAPIVPTQLSLILLATLHPKKWSYTAFCFSVGATLGALLLAYVIKVWGLDFAQQIFGDAMNSAGWISVADWVREYGAAALFVLSCAPFPVRSAVAACALADMPLFSIALAVLGGRLLAFHLVAFLAAHSPTVLAKVPGFGKAFRTLTQIQKRSL